MAFVDYSTAYPSAPRDRLSYILLYNGIVGHMWHHLRARIDNIRLRVLHPNIQEHIKMLTFSEGSLKVTASAPPYSAYLLLTLSMNSKLNFPMLLLILHLVSNATEQRKFGLVGYCMQMISRSCPPARASCKPCYISTRNGVSEIACRSTHRKPKS